MKNKKIKLKSTLITAMLLIFTFIVSPLLLSKLITKIANINDFWFAYALGLLSTWGILFFCYLAYIVYCDIQDFFESKGNE